MPYHCLLPLYQEKASLYEADEKTAAGYYKKYQSMMIHHADSHIL